VSRQPWDRLSGLLTSSYSRTGDLKTYCIVINILKAVAEACGLKQSHSRFCSDEKSGAFRFDRLPAVGRGLGG
jgi:hypothetical protein